MRERGLVSAAGEMEEVKNGYFSGYLSSLGTLAQWLLTPAVGRRVPGSVGGGQVWGRGPQTGASSWKPAAVGR